LIELKLFGLKNQKDYFTQGITGVDALSLNDENFN
jgi:hypothetical protein